MGSSLSQEDKENVVGYKYFTQWRLQDVQVPTRLCRAVVCLTVMWRDDAHPPLLCLGVGHVCSRTHRRVPGNACSAFLSKGNGCARLLTSGRQVVTAVTASRQDTRAKVVVLGLKKREGRTCLLRA